MAEVVEIGTCRRNRPAPPLWLKRLRAR